MQKITFLDFCSGIGGGRIGLENLGMNCLGFSEIDKDAEITYREFFGDDEINYGDGIDNAYKLSFYSLPILLTLLDYWQ